MALSSKCSTQPCDTALAAVQKDKALDGSGHVIGESLLVDGTWQVTKLGSKTRFKKCICYDSYLTIKEPFEINLIYLNVHFCFIFFLCL